MAARRTVVGIRGATATRHDFANTVAVAVGTGRAEHHFALQEHGRRARVFRAKGQRQWFPLPQTRSICILKDRFHGWMVQLLQYLGY